MKKLLLRFFVVSCFSCCGMREAKFFSKKEMLLALSYMEEMKRVGQQKIEKNVADQKLFEAMKSLAQLYHISPNIGSIACEDYEKGSQLLQKQTTLFSSKKNPFINYPIATFFSNEDLLFFAENFKAPCNSNFWCAYLARHFTPTWVTGEESVLNELLKILN